MRCHDRKWLVWLACVFFVSGGLVACGGEAEQGPVGEQGPAGEEGPAGEDGEDGSTSLVDIEDVEPGGDCEFGGVVVHSGVDANGDGELSQDEVDSTNYVCAVGGAGADCEDPLAISGLTGLDQPFFDGVESDPIQLDTNLDEGITLSFLGDEASFDQTSDSGEFTMSPAGVGTNSFAVIASSECGVAATEFSAESQPADASISVVHLIEEAGALSLDDTAAEESLGSFEYGESTPDFDVSEGNYELALSADGTEIAVLDALDLEIGDSVTIVVHGTDEDVQYAVLENDLNRDTTDGHAALRPFHGVSGAGDVDLHVRNDDDSTTSLIDDLAYGDIVDPVEVEAGTTNLVTIDDADDEIDFYTVDTLFGSGDYYNLFALPVGGELTLWAHDPSSGDLITVFDGEILFHEDFRAGELPADLITGGDADWFVTDADPSTGLYSLQAGEIGNSQLTWVEVELEVTEPATLRFDWKASSESSYDELFFCVDRDLCEDGSSELEISGLTDWTTESYSIDEAGTYTFQWAYDKDSSDSDYLDTGWIDNILLVAQ